MKALVVQVKFAAAHTLPGLHASVDENLHHPPAVAAKEMAATHWNAAAQWNGRSLRAMADTNTRARDSASQAAAVRVQLSRF
jgi:hypothetical protein